MKLDEFERVQGLLTQALNVAAYHMGGDRSVAEAKGHIRQAIDKIDKAKKSQLRKKARTNDQFEQWWGDVQSGVSQVAASPMSPEAQCKTLAQLNAMIDEEKRKLAELEKASDQKKLDQQDDLMID